MGRIFRSAFRLGLLIFSVCFVFYGTSCRPFEKSDTTRQIDTLESMLQLTNNLLVIDAKVIDNRLDSMAALISYFEQNPIDSSAKEAADALITYKGIASIYRNFVEYYPPLEYDLQAERKKLVNFKEQATGGDNAALLAELLKAKKNAQQLLNASQGIVKKIYSVENEYKRTNTTLSEQKKKQKK